MLERECLVWTSLVARLINRMNMKLGSKFFNFLRIKTQLHKRLQRVIVVDSATHSQKDGVESNRGSFKKEQRPLCCSCATHIQLAKWHTGTLNYQPTICLSHDSLLTLIGRDMELIAALNAIYIEEHHGPLSDTGLTNTNLSDWTLMGPWAAMPGWRPLQSKLNLYNAES